VATRRELQSYLFPDKFGFTEDLGGKTSSFFDLLNDPIYRAKQGIDPIEGGDVFQRRELEPALGEIFDFDKGTFTEDFLKAGPKEGLIFEGQADKIQKALDTLDDYKDAGTVLDKYQRMLLEKALERAKEGEKISRLDLTPLQLKMGLVNPVQSGVTNLPEFQVANLNFGQPTYTDTGIASVFPTQVSTPDLATQIRQEQAAASQRAQNASQAQESRNQSRDDYTGGGGTVVIGTGGGQTKTVSPRSREAMYAAPTSSPLPPPIRRFDKGGIVSLLGGF